jgi:hypothetical protein
VYRWHADRHRIWPTHCSHTRFNTAEAGDAELRRRLRGDRSVMIDNANELDTLPRLLKLAIDAQMIAPERPGSHNRDAQWLRSWHYFESTGASTALRQRA